CSRRLPRLHLTDASATESPHSIWTERRLSKPLRSSRTSRSRRRSDLPPLFDATSASAAALRGGGGAPAWLRAPGERALERDRRRDPGGTQQPRPTVWTRRCVAENR